MSVFGTGHPTISRAAIAGAVLVVLIAPFLPASVSAKSTTWSDVALLNSNWSDALNWSNGVPVDGDTVYFAAIGGVSNIDIEALSVGKLDMSGYAGSLTQQTIVFGVNSDLIVDGTFNGGSFLVGGDVVVDGTFKVQGRVSIRGDLHVNGTVDCYTWSGQIELGGDFPGTNTGTVNMGDGALELQGNGDFSNLASMIWSLSYGELKLSGSGPQSVTVSAASNIFYDITVDRMNDTDVTTITSTGTGITTNGLLTVNEGVLDFQCDVTASWGTEIYSGGVLRFLGAPRTVQLLGGVFVYGGLLSVLSPGSSLQVSPFSLAPFHVSGGASLEIVSHNQVPISLAQDGTPGGSQWGLYADTGANVFIAGVVIEDGGNVGPTAVRLFNAVDGGNNASWLFDGSMWTGTGATSSWSEPDNWGGVAIATGNVVAFWHTSGVSVQDIPALSISALDMTRFNGTLELSQDLTVVNDAGIVATSVLNTGGRALHFGDDVDVWGGLINAGGLMIVDSRARIHSGYVETYSGTSQFYGVVEVGPTAELNVHGDSDVEFFTTVFVDGTFHALGENINVSFAPNPDAFEINSTGSFLVNGFWPPSINLYCDGTLGDPRWTLRHAPGSTVSVEGARVMDGYADPDVTAYNSADDGNNFGWHFVVTGTGEPAPAPHELVVTAAPNPFNPVTTLFVDLPAAGPVTVRVYDVGGRLVRTLMEERRPAGRHGVVWDGRDDGARRVASGIYLYDVVHAGERVRGKMVMLK